MKTFLVAALVSVCGFAADPSLTETIKAGQRAAAIDMIAKKPTDVNAVEADGSTPLLWAVNLNDADLAARLLKAGADPKVRNRLGSTPLAEAAFNSNTEMLKALLDAGADGQTPLMIVARTANVAAAKLLLGKGANPNAAEAQKNQTALMWAAAASQ